MGAMPNTQRIRETLADIPSQDYLQKRLESGWRLVALEWERDAPLLAEREHWVEEIPYGLRVSSDCSRLVESPEEIAVIVTALDRIVEDCPLSQVADELNRRGHRTRQGKPWSAAAIFNLLPRMIEVGPRVFASAEWATRRERLPKVG